MEFRDFAPATKAEAAAAQTAPGARPAAAPAASSRPAPLPAAPAPAEGALFVGAAARSRAFPLEHALAYQGRVYDTIVLRRPTSVEVGRFFEELVSVTALAPDALLYFPVFVDEEGEPIPPAVLDMLDDDDRTPIMARVADFLPRRFLALRAAGEPALPPPTGASTAPTSST